MAFSIALAGRLRIDEFAVGLACEYAVEILESFHLDRIAARIKEEHRTLFSRLSLEPNNRRDVEGDAGGLQPAGELKPFVKGEDDAEMRHHDHMLSHPASPRDFERLAEMKGYLMAEKVEVDPSLGASPLAASKDSTIKRSGVVEICNMIG
jgi:hypothetical protein